MVELRGISKYFPENKVQALNKVTCRFISGRIYALAGENGAGKSTLMKILAGRIRPDEGSVFIEEKEQRFKSSFQAAVCGIRMIYQDPQLVDSWTLLDNCLAGREEAGLLAPLSRRKMLEKFLRTARKFGLGPEFSLKAGKASPFQKLTALLTVSLENSAGRGPAVLILDEPTEVLTLPETGELFRILRLCADSGMTVLMISHKIREIRAVCGSAVILRKGECLAELELSEVSDQALAELMIGSGLEQDSGPGLRLSSDRTGKSGEPARMLLRLEDLESLSGSIRVSGISLKEGEILGITGIRHEGLSALEAALTGEPGFKLKSLEIFGKPYPGFSFPLIRKLGISYIPEQRMTLAASINSSVLDNALLKIYRNVFKIGCNHRSGEGKAAAEIKEIFPLPQNLKQPLSHLSGGNIQRVILGRELAGNPKLVIISEPGTGLDVAARDLLRQRIFKLADQGAGILVLSSDLDEIFSLCLQYYIFQEGKLLGPFSDLDRERAAEIMLSGGFL